MNSKQTIILFVLVLGTLMGTLDSTIVILAFPAIAEGLHSDIATTIWIILIYLLVTAETTTPFGRIGDLYGRSICSMQDLQYLPLGQFLWDSPKYSVVDTIQGSSNP